MAPLHFSCSLIFPLFSFFSFTFPDTSLAHIPISPETTVADLITFEPSLAGKERGAARIPRLGVDLGKLFGGT